MADDFGRAFDGVGAPFLHAGAVDVLAAVLYVVRVSEGF